MGRSFCVGGGAGADQLRPPPPPPPARKLVSHELVLGDDDGCATALLRWLAFLAAVYLLALDRTNWRTNMLTALLVPYIFFTLPNELFFLFSGEIGKWIAGITVVLRLFYTRQFPEWLELSGSVIVLAAAGPKAPKHAAYSYSYTINIDWLGDLICLIIACHLLREHVRASGGVRMALKRGKRLSNTVGILLLFVYPLWALARRARLDVVDTAPQNSAVLAVG